MRVLRAGPGPQVPALEFGSGARRFQTRESEKNAGRRGGEQTEAEQGGSSEQGDGVFDPMQVK